jgi:hypothetical protein
MKYSDSPETNLTADLLPSGSSPVNQSQHLDQKSAKIFPIFACKQQLQPWHARCLVETRTECQYGCELVHKNTSSRRNAMNEEQHNTSEDLAMEAEPWEEWEGKLVKYSLLIGVAALIVLGTLVNVFILS